jgi:GTP cyclohydrolase I
MTTIENIERHYAGILKALVPDSQREGLDKTPLRAAGSLAYLTEGYRDDPKEVLASSVFHENYRQMVLVKDIEMYSMCEHHLLPFFGKAHVAYIPNGKITGLSKIARVVDIFARRLQVQERLTMEIRDCIQEALSPMGVAVVIEAQHLCTMMRGVEKQNSVMTTSCMLGSFRRESATRAEFMALIRKSSH